MFAIGRPQSGENGGLRGGLRNYPNLKGPHMPLTDTAIKALKPRDKDYKATDEKGLYLLVTSSGGRLWKWKFRTLAGLEKKLSLGSYPDVSLKDARDSRDEARRILASGTDPAEKKRRDKHAAKVGAANSFSAVAEAYIKKNRRDGLAEATILKREWFLKLVERSLGHRPIAEIAPFEVLEAVRPFEAAKNNEKAHRTLQFIGQVFRYAVANQLSASKGRRIIGAKLFSHSSPFIFGA